MRKTAEKKSSFLHGCLVNLILRRGIEGHGRTEEEGKKMMMILEIVYRRGGKTGVAALESAARGKKEH